MVDFFDLFIGCKRVINLASRLKKSINDGIQNGRVGNTISEASANAVNATVMHSCVMTDVSSRRRRIIWREVA